MYHLSVDRQQSSELHMAFNGSSKAPITKTYNVIMLTCLWLHNFIVVMSEIGARYKKVYPYHRVEHKARIAKMFKLCEFVFSAFG